MNIVIGLHYYETRSTGTVPRDLYKLSRGRITPEYVVAQYCLTTARRAKPPYHQLGAFGPSFDKMTVPHFGQLLINLSVSAAHISDQ